MSHPYKPKPETPYSAAQAVALCRSYWPGAKVFVSFHSDDGFVSVGWLRESGTVGASFSGSNFNEALALAAGHKFTSYLD